MPKHKVDESQVPKEESKSKRQKSSIPNCSSFVELKSADDINQFWTFKQFQGRGSYGTVVSGIRRGFANHVALKTITNQGQQKTKPDLDVQREISYLQQCKGNKFICQIIDSFFSSKHLDQPAQTMIFMELYDTSLYHYLAQPTGMVPIPLQEKLACFNLAKDHLSQGLLTLHKLGILHRDLSTKNVFLKIDPITKLPYHYVIGDLGMARQLSHPWRDSVTAVKSHLARESFEPWIGVGDSGDDDLLSLNVTTVTYRAPELLLGAKNYSWPIDYWSLGVILYDTLVRQHPFERRGKKMGENDKRNFKNIIWPIFDPILAARGDCTLGDQFRPKTPKDLATCNQTPTWPSRVINTYPADALEAINSFLILNPAKRFDLSLFRQHFIPN